MKFRSIGRHTAKAQSDNNSARNEASYNAYIERKQAEYNDEYGQMMDAEYADMDAAYGDR